MDTWKLCISTEHFSVFQFVVLVLRSTVFLFWSTLAASVSPISSRSRQLFFCWKSSITATVCDLPNTKTELKEEWILHSPGGLKQRSKLLSGIWKNLFVDVFNFMSCYYDNVVQVVCFLLKFSGKQALFHQEYRNHDEFTQDFMHGLIQGEYIN